MLPKSDNTNLIIFFDGVCYLCNSTVNFLIKIDKKKKIKFSSLQSDFAKNSILTANQNPNKFDSIIVQKGEELFIKSEAVSLIIKELSWYWRIFLIIDFLPRRWSDRMYDFIAQNRYKWFGRRDTCMIPTDKVRDRFIL